MSLVFISYARENREVAERFAHALGELGIGVWWDRDLPGGSAFADVLEQRLAEAHVVVVLWSAASVRSGFVRDESSRALEAGKLLPVRIEDVVPPLGFGQIHMLDLLDWDGEHDDAAFARIAAEIRSKLSGPAPVPGTSQPTATVPPRWRRRRVWMLGAAVIVLLAGLGAWQAWVSNESSRNLRLGIEEQFGREPNLQAARNFYLDALAHRPGNARARYYIGHVYAQLGETELARSSFERALGDRNGLDDAQIADAGARVKALAPRDEPAALARAVEPVKGSASIPSVGTLGSGIAKPVPALAQLVRIPPPDPVREQVALLVGQMFGDDSERRIGSTTTLVTDADLLSDAVPVALDRALNALTVAAAPPTAAQSGVLNTLVLLQAASPATLTVHRADIERLLPRVASLGPHAAEQAQRVRTLLAAAGKQRPVAFIQVANAAQRPIAEALAVRLRAAGYDAPGIEVVGARAPATAAVRVQGRSDRGLARWLAKVAQDAGGAAVAVQPLRNAQPRTDTFEIWFDRALCTAERPAAACAQ